MAASKPQHRVAFAGFSVSESNKLKSHLQTFNALPDYIVGPTTSVVVVPSSQPLDTANSKISQARRYNIPIVTEDYIFQSASCGIALPTANFLRASVDVKNSASADEINDSFFNVMNKKRVEDNSSVRSLRNRPAVARTFSQAFPDADAVSQETSTELELPDPKRSKLSETSSADNSKQKHRERQKIAAGKWTTARVFISSTFKDMHGERDYLTRYVFPELQERCDRLRVHLHPVDLRWGVTEEDTSNALEICLSEVDSCRPFFLGLLGDRYGWRPERYVVPDEPRFDWIKAMPSGLSITHLEMYYGVLRQPEQAGYAFCLRDPDFMRDVPSQHQDDFKTESIEHKYNLDKLREEIRSKCDPSNVLDQYPCNWGGLIDGKPSTSALEKFGQFVLDTLWRHIERQFGAQEMHEADALTAERAMHEQFAESHSRLFVGRQNLINELVSYCESMTPPAGNATNVPMVVLGEPGAGKTSLMSYFANRYAIQSRDSSNADVIFHFVGAAPGSTNVRQMISRLVHEITLKVGSDEQKEALNSIPEEYKDLKAYFAELLKSFGKDRPSSRLVLILDALNQLEDSYQAHSLDWLPEELPNNVRIVVSTLKGAVFDSLERRNKTVLLVGALSRAECIEIIEKTLMEYRKKLTPQQIDLLLRKADAFKPLYLVVACEELRVFGVFEKLTDRIKSMAETVPELFSEVLARLETDHGSEIVENTMSFIACSKGGLLEEELLSLLGSEEDGPMPQSVWSRFYRSLKAYVRPAGDIIDFFHQQLPKAVKKRYLTGGNSEYFKLIHSNLGKYFEACADPELDHTWTAGHRRGLAFAPYHYTMGEKWDRLLFSLCNLAFIEAKCEAGMTYDLVSDYLLATGRKDDLPADVASAIEEYQRFVMQRSHVLAHHSDLCFSMAASLPNNSRPAEEAMSRYRSRLENRPWMKWLNKPQTANPCIMTLNGHDMVVRCSAFSPSGSLIASAADDSKIKLWNATTGEETKTLSGHKQSITCMEFSPDGDYLATGSYDRTIKVWSVSSGDEVVSLRGHKGQVAALIWGPDSRTIYSGGQDRILRMWKPFSSSSSNTFGGAEDESESSACVKTFSGHNRPVRCVAISPSGRLLASSGEDNAIFLWDLTAAEGTAPRELTGHAKACNWLSFYSESKLASCADDRSVRVWNVDDCTETLSYNVHRDGVCSVFWGPSGESLLSASHDNIICLYDLKENKTKSILIGHTGSVFRASFSPDFKNIVSSSFDRSVKVWAVMDKVEVHGHDARILCIAFSPSGRLLVTGSRDKTAKIWDVASGNELRTLTGHTSNVFGVCFSPDGETIATASRDMTVRLWNVNSGECWAVLSGHTSIVRSVDWHPNGRQLASCGDDKKMLIWDAEHILAAKRPGELLDITSAFGSSSQFGHHKTVSRVKYSPDGRRCASTSDDTSAKMWDTKVDTVPAKAYVKVATLTGHKKPVNSCGFSPDNSRIVTASDDTTVRCWSAKNARMIAELKKHTEAVTDVTYTADGWIFSGSTDATVVLWDSLTFQPAVSFACLSRVCAVAASPQGHIFAAGDGSGMLMLLTPVDLPKSSAELQHAAAQSAAPAAENGPANSTFSQTL